MSHTCETVTIETEAGPVVINKSDFKKGKHTLVTDKPAAPKAPTLPEIKTELKRLGVEFDAKAKKPALEALLAKVNEEMATTLADLLATFPGKSDADLAVHAEDKDEAISEAAKAEIANRAA